MRSSDGGLLRSSRAGAAHIDAFLEDYALMIRGLLAALAIIEDVNGSTIDLQMPTPFIQSTLHVADGASWPLSTSHKATTSRRRKLLVRV